MASDRPSKAARDCQPKRCSKCGGTQIMYERDTLAGEEWVCLPCSYRVSVNKEFRPRPAPVRRHKR